MSGDDNSPIPVLRRAPVLLHSQWHAEPIRQSDSTWESQDSNTRDGNLRRSISHRISRVATTTTRNLSESLRRTRSVSQSRVQRGQVKYGDDIRIRKVHAKDDSTGPLFASSPRAGGSSGGRTIAFASAHDGHSARLRDLVMQTVSVDQQNGRASVAEVPVPALLQQGVPMTKVSAKSQKSYLFKLDADQGQIIWESKRLRISTCPLVG